MATPAVGIVGMGSLGLALGQLFPEAVQYDEPKGIGRRADINACDFVFVCVPTPASPSGACDVSIVEEVVGWIDGPTIILRSTVPPGTTERLAAGGKKVVFQPEYGPADTPDHPYNNLRDIRWVILGGERAHTRPVVGLYQRVFNSTITIHQTDARTAELCKYMENAYLASKVAFCNVFYDIATASGVDFTELRELWLLDPRIGRSHTFVFEDDRGFGGKCLPKDFAAILAEGRHLGVDTTMLEGVWQYNERLRAMRD